MNISVIGFYLLASGALFAQQYVISTNAGGGPPPTPIPGSKLAILPQGLAADASGNVYFLSSNCVFKLDPNGIVSRVAGNSRPGYAGDGGPALSAQFYFASGVAVDSSGNLYVGDTANRRVRKVSSAGIITTIAGTGVQGFSGDGGPATNAQLLGPSGLTTDATGNLYIVDDLRIRKIDTTGVITTVAGNGTGGFSGDGSQATNAQLSSPYGVAVDGSGNLFISDDGNRRVRKVASNGIITTVAGTGTYGSAGDGGPAISAQLTGASGIAVDKTGNLYISDSSPLNDNDDCACVRKVSPAGVISTFGPGAGLRSLRDLALDPAGNLFIDDIGYGLIRKVSPAGVITVAAGSGDDVNFFGDGGPAGSAHFHLPLGLAAATDGSVYVADTYNNRVRKISPAGIVTTVAGTAGELYYPVGVAVDSQGNLYIGDHGNLSVRKVSGSGVITAVANGSYDGRPVWALAVDKNDDLYLPNSSNNQISKISPAGVITIVAGNGAYGYSGDGGPATSAQIRLTPKAALATDGEGSLYFADDDVQPPPPGTPPDSPTLSTPRIRKVSPDGTITTVAGNGTSGFSGDGGPAIKAQLGSQLNYPIALATDKAGNLFIADGANARVRMVAKDGTITTVAGTGVYGYSGDGGPATSAQFVGPSALTTDAAGNVYIADGNVIRVLQPLSSSQRLIEIANAASHAGGTVTPGEVVVMSGSGVGPAQLAVAAPGPDGLYPTQLGGTRVEVNGTPAPLIYTWSTQVGLVVPYSVVSGTAQITLSYQGSIATLGPIKVVPSNPGIFTLDQSGEGQAVALNADQSVNSAANPAKAGSVISLFVTGEGETSLAGVDGMVAQARAPQPILPVVVTIGGTAVTPIYAGGSAGSIAGVMRVDAQIPSGVQAGPAIPVVVRVGSSSSQPVMIAVQ